MSREIVEPIEKYGLSQKARKKTLFSKIGIIGCGLEGQNIARFSAFNGIEVVFIELTKEKIDKAILNISKALDNRIENWGLTPSEKKAIMGRIKGTKDYEDLKDCEFIIEAIRRDDSGRRKSETRKDIFKRIESVVSENCIISTNTTSVVITELASELIHKERCVSLHFMVASPEARIVEVVKGLYTTDEVYERVSQFVKLINRRVIPVEESVGFVSIRMFVTMLNEACDILMEGVAEKEDINTLSEVGFGMRFGIFYTADILGLEKVVRWGENLFEEFGHEKYKPSPLIKRLVRAKRIGVETGEGFFKYDENGKRITESILKNV